MFGSGPTGDFRIDYAEPSNVAKASMPRRTLVRKWTDDDVAKLNELIDAGATLTRAAAALNRNTRSVQKKARELGKHLPGVRTVRADLRNSGALDPKIK